MSGEHDAPAGVPTTAFEPYVPTLAAEWARAAGDAPHRRLTGTIAFADLSGFTRLSERLARRGRIGAEQVTEVVNTYFAEMLDISDALGGDVLKFGGDALLSFFTGDAHALRAAETVTAQRRALRTLPSVETSSGRVRVGMSAGIWTGQIDAFLVGSQHRELILAGPAVTGVKRLEGSADRGQIMVGSATGRSLRDHANLKSTHRGRLLLRMHHHSESSANEEALGGQDLSQYIPAPIRAEIASGGYDAEHRPVAIAFMRGAGIDPIVKDDPAKAASVLSIVVDQIERIAADEGLCFLQTDVDEGAVKFMLLAGVPRTGDNDTERLLSGVLAIRELSPIPLQIGLTTGQVFSGDVGSRRRRTFTVMGDSVNLAARVMTRASPGEVLVERGALRHLRVALHGVPVEPFSAKGKSALVEAMSVDGIGARQRHTFSESPLVGRDSDAQQLEELLSSAETGFGEVAEIVARAGLGKTRLVDHFMASVTIPIVRVQCEQHRSRTAYFVAQRLLRVLVGIPADADRRAAGAALRAILRRHTPDALPFLPLIAPAFNAQVRSTKAAREVEPEFRTSRGLALVGELLTSVAADGPRLLLIEDTHWIDDASAELLDSIAAVVRQAPWLLLMTRRPLGSRPLAGPRISIWLQPLAPSAIKSLIESVPGADRFRRETIAALVERAGGNPLFAVELASNADAQAGVRDLPESVEALIRSRLSDLSRPTRQALRVAAVFGEGWSLDDVFQMGNIDRASHPELTRTLDELTEVEEDERRRFTHALIREVVYESIPFAERQSLHGQVARHIESQLGPDADQSAPALADHFYLSRDDREAWHYCLIAADQADAQSANVESAVFWDRAVEVATRSPGAVRTPRQKISALAERAGSSWEIAGEYFNAERSFREARELWSGSVPDQARLTRRLGELQERVGKYAQALRWYSRATGLLRGRRGKRALLERTRIQNAYAGVRFRQGKLKDSIEWAERARTSADRAHDDVGLAHALYLIDNARHDLNGLPPLYRRQALETFIATGDLVHQADVLNNMGADAYYTGDWDESLEHYRKALVTRERIGDEVGAATQENNIAEILVERGELEEAERLSHRASRTWKASDYAVGIALADANLGRIAALRGDTEQAESLLRAAAQQLGEMGAVALAEELEARLAEASLICGDRHEAGRIAARQLRTASTSGARALLEFVRGSALGDRDPSAARTAHVNGATHARDADNELLLARNLAAFAELDGATDPRAIEIFTRLGVKSDRRESSVPSRRTA